MLLLCPPSEVLILGTVLVLSVFLSNSFARIPPPPTPPRTITTESYSGSIQKNDFGSGYRAPNDAFFSDDLNTIGIANRAGVFNFILYNGLDGVGGSSSAPTPVFDVQFSPVATFTPPTDWVLTRANGGWLALQDFFFLFYVSSPCRCIRIFYICIAYLVLPVYRLQRRCFDGSQDQQF